MIIHLLSNPRNVSTALMYAFAQRSDTHVLDEPFYAYYLHSSGVSHPGDEDILANMHKKPENIFKHIYKSSLLNEHLFIKNMAHHSRGLDKLNFKDWFNIIFIRHPEEVLASFNKVVASPTLQDIAIKDQYDLAVFFKDHNIPYYVLDSRHLLHDPESALTRLCLKLRLNFEPDMLKWDKGPKAFDGIWAPYWYKNVHQSTGFVRPSHFGKNALPEHLQPVLKEALLYYNKLIEHTLI